MSHPDVVKGIAQAYISAGSDIVETNSFGGSSLQAEGLMAWPIRSGVQSRAAALAKAAMGDKGFVAASVGPTGHIVEDEGGDSSAAGQLYRRFKEQVIALEEGGADAICMETMSSLDGGRSRLSRRPKRTPSFPSFAPSLSKRARKGFRTMMGVKPDRAARAAVAAGADIVGANCGNGIANMIEIMKQMRAAAPSTPILVHANAGARCGGR